MCIRDSLMDPVYITGAPKTFVLKLCIGLITGLVAHKIAKINETNDKKYVFKWSLIASIAGLDVYKRQNWMQASLKLRTFIRLRSALLPRLCAAN